MAKQTAEQTKPQQHTMVRVSKDTHRRLRVRAAELDIGISEAAEQALQLFLDRAIKK